MRRMGTFVDHAKDERRSGDNQVLLQILVDSDEAHLKGFGFRLLESAKC